MAELLAAHALLGFFTLLLVLLGGITLLAFGLRRHPYHRAAVMAGTLGAVALFVGLALLNGAQQELGQFEVALSQALQVSTSPASRHIFGWITHLGDGRTLTLLCIVVALGLLLARRHILALTWILAVAGNGVLNAFLKQWLQHARPLHGPDFPLAQGWSFPSGHSSGAMVAYGMLAYFIIRLRPGKTPLPPLLIAATLIFSTGCSRVFLQAHYVSDVLAGFSSGAAWLLMCICIAESSIGGPGRAKLSPPRRKLKDQQS